jgi:hypothetical protein
MPDGGEKSSRTKISARCPPATGVSVLPILRPLHLCTRYTPIHSPPSGCSKPKGFKWNPTPTSPSRTPTSQDNQQSIQQCRLCPCLSPLHNLLNRPLSKQHSRRAPSLVPSRRQMPQVSRTSRPPRPPSHKCLLHTDQDCMTEFCRAWLADRRWSMVSNSR